MRGQVEGREKTYTGRKFRRLSRLLARNKINSAEIQINQEEFDAFWRTLSILSLIILIIVVMVYIVSVKVFKRTIGKTLLGVVILLAVNVIILVLTNATTVLIFVAAVLYIVYLVQTIVNIRKF